MKIKLICCAATWSTVGRCGIDAALLVWGTCLLPSPAPHARTRCLIF